MSKDNLEQFIQNNRQAFDSFDPDPGLFRGVKTRRPVVRMHAWSSLVWKAAAVAAIFVAGYFANDWISRVPPAPMHAETHAGNTDIVTMLIEAEAYYTAQIDSRKKEFYTLASGNPQLKQEIDYELVELDSIYGELKRDLKDNAANEEVIEAMIQNYRIKLNILEDVLGQMQAAKHRNNQKEEKHATQL